MNILRIVKTCKSVHAGQKGLLNSYRQICNPDNFVRKFSFQSAINDLVKTQAGIFQTISESTPVECMQNLLLNVHSATGLPWWATIVCTTIFLRASITVPLAVYQQYILAKVERVNLEIPEIAKELAKEVSIAVKLYNWDEKTAKIQYKINMRKQWKKLIERDNCHPVKASLLLWFQIPMWVCLSVGLRNLVYELPKQDFDAKITFMELTVGGCLWFPNLIAADSTFILPVAFGLLNYAILEIQTLTKTTPPSKVYKYFTYFFKGVIVIMVPVAASVPSCLALYWTTSSAFGLIQNIALLSPRIKTFCRIPTTPSQLSKPYDHLYNSFKEKYTKRFF